ncbi:MAG: UDPglucose 6-dehydrogenase, partial [Acidimicrobiaceae bacterium]|nr:UDPglucose 6-dehydrogenase [Acidimicrobiaceae bacterium]
GMGYDKRIGFEFLKPGPGWGGSCFPKDSHALVRIAAEAGYNFELLKGVIAVNDQQFQLLADRVADLAGGTLEGSIVAVWGLTFKAGTDDLRSSPAIEIVERLIAAGATVRAYDPTVSKSLPDHFGHLAVEVCDDAYAACAGAAVLAVLTEWDEFRWLDFDKVAGVMGAPAILDARNLLDPVSLRRRGFTYQGLGRR